MVEMVCLSLSFEKQSETVANSLAGGQKAKHPNEFKCNNKLKLEFEFKFKLVRIRIRIVRQFYFCITGY